MSNTLPSMSSRNEIPLALSPINILSLTAPQTAPYRHLSGQAVNMSRWIISPSKRRHLALSGPRRKISTRCSLLTAFYITKSPCCVVLPVLAKAIWLWLICSSCWKPTRLNHRVHQPLRHIRRCPSWFLPRHPQ